jgi:23S rRNA-/tRNA-specific pseudouridylate synthase
VHLSAIGHPVVGDDLYGDGRRPPAPLAALDRMFLHATRLGFDHPVTGEHLAFDSPLPAELAAALAELGHEMQDRG